MAVVMEKFRLWRNKCRAAFAASDLPLETSFDQALPNPQPDNGTEPCQSKASRVPSFPDGVKVIHDCPDATVDICFVHGPTGDRESAWTVRGQSTPWLRTLLAPKLHNARILTYGYDAYMVRKKSVTSSNRLIDHATNLLHDLTTDRASCNASSRPLIFVAHSLGGLVCKVAILRSQHHAEVHCRSIFDCTIGVIFMGTPHRGTWMAHWAKIPVSALGPFKSTNGRLLDLLQSDNQLLESIHVNFSGMIRQLQQSGRSIEVTCFFEELPLPAIGMVVPKESATFDGYDPVSIHANHRDMVRFSSAEDNGFKRLLGELVRWESQIRNLRCGKTEEPPLKPSSSVEQLGSSCLNHSCGYQISANASGSGNQYNVFGSGNQYNTDGSGSQYFGQNQYFELRNPSAAVAEPANGCLRSLAFPEMQGRFHDVRCAAAGTCKWLLQHRMYTSWADCDRGLLWIRGKPKSGKSTLLKYALGNHEAGDSALVLSFFFDSRGDRLQRTPLGLFRSLLHQLLTQAPSTLVDLVNAFEEKLMGIGEPGEKWQWHQEELWHFFKLCIPKVLDTHIVWLFIDALDECGKEDAVNLVETFKSLLKSLPPQSSGLKQFRICFSCRHYPILDLDAALDICLENENRKDISAYVQYRLSTSPMFMESNIPATITDRAQGVFLWAHLVVERILELDREGGTPEEIEKAMDSIPHDLDELYRELMRNMKPASLKLIQWICFATRPLSLDELRWAMIIDPDCRHQSLEECKNSKGFISDHGTMKRRIQTLSCGLVEVTPSPDAQLVQLIHQSAKEFFLRKGLSTLDNSSTSPDMAIGNAHFRLSRICIRYLAMKEFSQVEKLYPEAEEEQIIRQSDDMQSEFPFLHYATTSWVAHTKQSDAMGISQEDILEYLAWPSNALLEIWVHLYSHIRPRPFNYPPSGTTLVHVLSRNGILGPLRAILLTDQITKHISAKDGHGQTPLSLAAERGHEDVVKLLLDTGDVDVNSKDVEGLTPLALAAENGHEAIVKLLLGTGRADVKLKVAPSTPADKEEYGVVVELLDNDKVEVNLEDNCSKKALFVDAGEDHGTAVVKLS